MSTGNSVLGITKTIIGLGNKDAYQKYYKIKLIRYYRLQYEIEKGFIFNHLIKNLVSNVCTSLNVSLNEIISKYENQYINPDLLEKASCLVNTYVPFSNFQATKNEWLTLFKYRDEAMKNLKNDALNREIDRINIEQDILYQKGFANNYKDAKTFWGDLIMLAKGANGLIYESSKEELAKMFIIKYQISHRLTKKQNNMDIVHELHVNLVLNRYRSKIPNFMYGFGFFMCSTPLMRYEKKFTTQGVKEIDSICNVKGNNMFTILERINGITFKKWLRSKEYSLELFLNYYLQILFSLETAQDIFYSHNDLHVDNVILKPIKESSIEYKIDNVSYFITTRYIATIIDFGYSYIYTSRNFSIGGLINGGIYYNKPNQLLDAYKFFMYTMIEFIKKPKEFQELLPIFYYFINSNNDPVQWLKEEHEKRFSIPDLSNHIPHYTHKNLIKYILKIYKIVINKPTMALLSLEPVKSKELKDNIYLYTSLDFFYLSRTNKLTPELNKHFEINYVELENEVNYNKILSKHFITKVKTFNTSLDFYLNPVKGKGKLQFNKFTEIRNDSIVLLDLASQLINKRDILIYNYFKRSKHERDKNLTKKVDNVLFSNSNDIWNGIVLLNGIYYRMLHEEDNNSVYVYYLEGKQKNMIESFNQRTREYKNALKIKNQIIDYREIFLILNRVKYLSGMYPLNPNKIKSNFKKKK